MVQPQRIDGARSFARGKSSLVAIGNFDGVHLGHRAVLARAEHAAHEKGLALVVLTFHPHPSEVLGRGRLAVLTPLERKVELLCRVAPELQVVVEPFTMELASMSPKAFAEELLARDLSARVVVVGQNFRFGKDRAGDLHLLEELGKSLGFEARAEPLAGDQGGTFSSSRIRACIAEGDLHAARRLLGRPHSLSGRVIRGDGRGRKIGVPTANLDAVLEALPPYGVYACLVDRIEDGGAVRVSTGVANIGERPTFGAGFSVEVHLHDFDGDLYGERLRVHLVERIRPEMKFDGIEALVARIRADIETARRATEHEKPDPAALGVWS